MEVYEKCDLYLRRSLIGRRGGECGSLIYPRISLNDFRLHKQES